MKVVVFGSTGKTGSELVKQLVGAGHTVTAFARHPEKVDTRGGKVRVLQGDARDEASVLRAVNGQDAVFHAVAQRYAKKDDLQTVFAELLTEAMKQAGVRRLIVLSAWGSGDSYQYARWFMKLGRYTILRNVFQDKARAEEIIIHSGLDYTLVRPGFLLNGPVQGGVKASRDGKGLKVPIRRADVAAFMVAQLHSTEWLNDSPLIGH